MMLNLIRYKSNRVFFFCSSPELARYVRLFKVTVDSLSQLLGMGSSAKAVEEKDLTTFEGPPIRVSFRVAGRSLLQHQRRNS